MRKANAILLVMFVIGLPVVSRAQSGLPLLQTNDLSYLGAFRLPTATFGASRFGYGGRGLAPYHDTATGKDTLFMEGHDWDAGCVAQVEIPATLIKTNAWSELPEATVLQNFYDVADGNWASLGPTAYVAVFGMLVHNGRLIVGAASWYDASGSQTASHGVAELDLSLTNDFEGFFVLDAVAGPRSLGGYMTPIPAEWQPSFGGPVLTGNAALSIIASISAGPAASVFDPDQLGVTNPVPATTVVYYPLAHYLVWGNTTDNTWTFGSNVKGVAFPAGTRTVLFFGRQTLATEYCYGPGTDDPELHLQPTEGGTWCYDLCDQSKGGHGYPYRHYVWAYDANELVDVKNGLQEPWEVEPYLGWALREMEDAGCAGIRSAAYDPETRRVYITQAFGEQPRVDVYHIGAASSETLPPAAPDGLVVE